MIAPDLELEAAVSMRMTLWSSPAGDAPAGGDWCDVFAISEHLIGLTIGDVSGHGSAVAGTMRTVSAAVVRALLERPVPSDALCVANDVAALEGDGIVATSIVAVLDRRAHTLTFANAGHPPPLMLTSAGHAFLMYPPADIPLGIFSNFRAADYVVTLPLDGLVVFYTDGITEHDRDPIAGEIELVAATRRVHGRPRRNEARAIAREVFRRGRGEDDAAAIGLRFMPTAVRSSRDALPVSRNGRSASNGVSQQP